MSLLTAQNQARTIGTQGTLPERSVNLNRTIGTQGTLTPVPVQLPSQAVVPPTGLIGSEQALQRGLAASLAGLSSGGDQARRDLQRALSTSLGRIGGVRGPSGDLRAAEGRGLQQISSAIGQGVAPIQQFVSAGQQAQQAQAALAGALGPEAQARALQEFAESPEQAFLREEAERSILRSASATGGLGGGNVLNELNRRAIGLASQDIQNRFNRLQALSGQGLTAAGQIGQLRGQQAGLASGLIGQLGSAGAGLEASLAAQKAAQQRAASDIAAQIGLEQARMSQTGGLTAADLAFRTGLQLSGGRTRAGEQIAGAIGGTTSALSDLISQLEYS
jgi:hypothetical protein